MAVRNSYSGSLLDNPDDPNVIDPALVMNTPIPGAPASPMGGSSNGLPTSNYLPMPSTATLSSQPAAPIAGAPSFTDVNAEYQTDLGRPLNESEYESYYDVPQVVGLDWKKQIASSPEASAYAKSQAAQSQPQPQSQTQAQVASSFSPSAGFSLPESALGEATSGGIQSLITNHGATPEETSLLDRVNQIIANGGALPGDTTLEQQQLESARENESHAFGAQLGDARDELANRGLVGEPGAPQGAEGEAISTISRNLAAPYAQSVRDIKSQQIQTQNARLTSAIQTATGLDENAANNLVAGLGEGTQRQVALSQIALDSLSQNTQWNEFLANYGLNRDQVLNSIQSGNASSLMTLLSLFEQMTGLASAGHI